MKLYEIRYGNGYYGSRTNIGTALVMVNNVHEAKILLYRKKGVKIGHQSRAIELDVVKEDEDEVD